MKISDLSALFALTIRDPSAAATHIIRQRIPSDIGWMVLILAALLSALLTSLVQIVAPPEPVELPDGSQMAMLNLSPFLWGALSVMASVVLTIVIFRLGRLQGGRAAFDEVLILMGWVQVIMVLAQGAQIIALVILPPLSFLIAVAGFVISFRALGHFVKTAHGFDGLGRAVGVIILSILAVSVLYVVVFAVAGVLPMPTPEGV